MLQEGIDAFESGDYQKCYDIFFDLGTYHRDGEAMFYMGVLYYEGYGVQKDEQEAISWWKKSSNRGNLDAKFRLESINMSTIVKF